MDIDRFTYGTIEKGASAGVPAFNLELSPGEESSPLGILEVIRGTTIGPVKVVQITAGEDTPEGEMTTLCKTLSDGGYLLQGISPGLAFHRWYHHIHQLIVQITEPVWMGFQCRELWMKAPATVAPADPTLPGGKIQGTTFYLDVSIADPGEVYSYITRSRIPWAVIPRASSSIQRNLLGGGE